jgi:hypothetical protein
LFVTRGSRRHIGDAIVKAAPEKFRMMDGSPLATA